MIGTVVPQEAILLGSIVSSSVVFGYIVPGTTLQGEMISPTIASMDSFDGPYSIEPKTVPQTFGTRHKSMSQDLEVTSIPYYEVSNQYGGSTIIIGGNG